MRLCPRYGPRVWPVGALAALVASCLACGDSVEPLRTTVLPAGGESDGGGVGVSVPQFPGVPQVGSSFGGAWPQEETPACTASDCGGQGEDEARASCGNAVLDPGEACDDGNALPGDGCSGACQPEPYFDCSAVGAPCLFLIRCGDGQRQGAEACDDGNALDGDGCSARCDAVEPLYSCPREGGPCATGVACGDGRVTGAEVCDDRNAVSGDGCSNDCFTVEPGWSCPSPGQPCVEPVVCGDGVVGFGEGCDDGNLDSGDGCTEACRRQAFFVCPVPGQPCESLLVCGDGTRVGPEACDDGGRSAGDGCDSRCRLEPGWTCPVAGGRCVAAACGDGLVAGAEQCDDANAVAGDGCTDCRLEPGFVCSSAPFQSPGSSCRPTVCNDGVREGGEACDDGNLVVGDGCSPFCQVEPSCGPGGCTSTCGDGLRLPSDSAEECDDGNALNGDGCSSDCLLEPGFDCADVERELPARLELPVTFRDFVANPVPGGPPRHPDFELFSGSAPTPGLVGARLGPDNKPVYTGLCEVGSAGAGCPFGEQTSGQAQFDQWFRNTPGVNRTRVALIGLQQRAGEVYQFPEILGNTSFFPMDRDGWVGAGLEDTTSVAGQAHNFGFTSEIRHWFEFRGDERLTFAGDDDVWVFINSRLALDLGGLHERREQTIVLEASTGDAVCTETEGGLGTAPCGVARRPLGLVVGQVYEVALFHAERHTVASNFDLTLGGFVGVSTQCQSVCGDGLQTAGEDCDDGLNDSSYGSCAADCTRGPHCGDGVLQAAYEQCDDGLNAAGYGEVGCAIGCVLPGRCGDGNLDSDSGEQCDDGVNDGSYGSCTADCRVGPRCGDGVVQSAAGEQCDDGQNDGSYGNCAPGCLLGARCGDGLVQAASEQCDDGQNDGSYGTCQAQCVLAPGCGDGVVQAAEGEQCDDGVNRGGYGACQPQCQLGPRCGDGQLQAAFGEQCDDGTNGGGYGQCAAGCQLGPRCGDGIVQPPEECDSANGCSSDCQRRLAVIE